MPPLPRLINDRYEVGEVIGRGGMATVHLGRDTRLGRKVAIKVLRPELAADDTFHERFQREAHAVASLNHHSIVSIFDTGEITPQGPDGVTRPYIVMEYVPGRTLREIIHGEGLTPEQAIEYMLGILDALSYSHRAGIVHRDIKPANVKVTPDGTVKVMDFGIARAVEDTQAALTQSQAVLGTAQYLSPEQARGAAVDARSDLYSAACVLFEMLTGRAPFVGESSVAIAAQHVRDAPPAPSSLNPQLPASVDRFMLTALAKDREHRFPDAGAMRRELRTVLHALPADLEATQAMDPTQVMDSSTKSLPVVGAGAATAQVVAAGRSEDAEHEATALYADPATGQGVDADSGYAAAAGAGGAGAGAGGVGGPHDAAGAGSPHGAGSAARGRRKGRGGWVLAAILTVILLTGAGVAAVMGVQWWQGQQNQQVEQISVPQVEGMDRTTAENTLRDAGLNPSFTDQPSDTVPEGRVSRVDPAAGTQVERDSAVTVTMSSGPDSVEVPRDLVGQSLDYSRDSLKDAGLRLGPVAKVNSASVPQDVVISTDPSGGTAVKKDSSVKAQVSTGKVTVPDVVGKSRGDAERILRGDDVRLNFDIAVRESEDAETGTVLEQSAPAGSSVSQGSTITLTVARKPSPSPTPTPSETPEPTETATAEPTTASPTPTPSRSVPSSGKPADDEE